MFQPTADAASSAASVLFNLPDYEVLEVARDDGDRTVVIATLAREAACPDCGVLSSQVHQRTRQRLADVPFDGHIEVVWIKKRWKCVEALCSRTTFAEHTDQVPPRARLTQRLRAAILEAVAGEVRAIDRIAGQFGVSWPTVQRIVDQAAAARATWRRTRPRLARQLGNTQRVTRKVGEPSKPGSPVRTCVPTTLTEIITLGRTLKKRADIDRLITHYSNAGWVADLAKKCVWKTEARANPRDNSALL